MAPKAFKTWMGQPYVVGIIIIVSENDPKAMFINMTYLNFDRKPPGLSKYRLFFETLTKPCKQKTVLLEK